MRMSRRSILALGATALTLPFFARHAAAQERRVVLASWGGGGARMWRRSYTEPFTRATGIQATVAEVPDPSAAIAAAQGRPQHNVFVAASYQAANLAQRGLIEELTPEDVPNIRKIPEQYWVRSPAGRLVGMPIYFLYYGIAYNTELAKVEDFRSWRALGERKWRNQISITRPVFLGPYDLTLCAKLNGGDESNIQPGIPMLEAMARNATSVYTSMASLQQQLSRGEVAAAPFYSSQVHGMRRAGQRNVDITLPQEGGLVLSYVISIPKGAPDAESARRFLNEVVNDEWQADAARDGYLPLAPSVQIASEVTQELGMTMEQVRQRNWAPNWYTIAADLENRIRLTEQIIDRAR